MSTAATSRRRRPAASSAAPVGPTPRRAAGADDFAATVMPHRDELLGAALRYTRNRADAEDLVQDTMARALAAWSRFEPGSNCRAWLFRILFNGFISGYRRRRRYNRFAHETGDDAVTALYGEEFERVGNPEDRLTDGLGDETRQALAELGADYYRVVVMADLRGVRYRDIAAELGVPIGTVMSRLFRARRQLEERLRDFAAADYGIRRPVAA
jgi:RNA polymerase sigma-70 factor (ECF subfamily)